MASQPVIVQRQGRLAIITLNAPERLNAINAEMGVLLDKAFAETGADPQIRAIMITGAGRSFCAGASMDRLDEVRGDRARLGGSDPAVFDAFDNAPEQLRTRYTIPMAIPKPVIAAVNGACAGAGLVLALACDIRIAGPQAKFIASFARMGLIAEGPMAYLLPRIIGFGRASDMLLSGRPVDADEALSWGLVSRLLTSEDFLEEASAAAAILAETVSPRSTRFIKAQLLDALSDVLTRSIDHATQGVREALMWPDLVEGISAFREKRLPAFPDAGI